MTKRTILITGVAGGMGEGQALAFLEAGDRVIGLDNDREALDAFKKSHLEYKDDMLLYAVDISNKQEVTTTMEEIWQKVDQVDVLVNTAGMFDQYDTLLETEEEQWDAIMDINVKGMFLLAQAVVPNMMENGKGNIINIASAAGFLQDGGGVAYTTSKHAVIGLTKKLAYDLGEKGIRVNGIAPGRITTDMNNNTDDLIRDNLPAQRNGNIEDIANATLFLASDQSDYMYGQIISVDGGWTIV